MIRADILVDSMNRTRGIELLGHAGCADSPLPGQELVCAAVSALVLNMANSVEHFTDDLFETQEDEISGLFSFRFSNGVSAEAALLMNSLVFGLLNLWETYPEPYLTVRYKEV